MGLDPYKNWINLDPVLEFLKLLLCCDVALSSPIGEVHNSPILPDDCEWMKKILSKVATNNKP